MWVAAEFQAPAWRSVVQDQAGMFSPEARQRLDGSLRQLWEAGGSQYAVLSVEDMGGETIEQASIKVADAWKLGNQKKDNGVLILIAKAEHRIRIEVGQGLEGDLTDLFCAHVIRETITPLLREGKADEALEQGLARLMEKSDPGLATLKAAPRDKVADGIRLVAALPLILMLGSLWFVFSVIGGLGRRRGRRGPWGGGFGGGGGVGGGSSGGSFGGGGGGGFSGGGSSGSW
ncbi:MAG: TPM domain-containing protein [candidate division FCPU426 bacterium]